MADANIKYGVAVTVPFAGSGLNSLASDANLLIGRQSSILDNTTNLGSNTQANWSDFEVSGLIAVATSGTLTADRAVEIYAFGLLGDDTSYTSGLAATDPNATVTLTVKKKGLLRLVEVIGTDATLSVVYQFGPIALSNVFGSVIPKKFGFWTTQSSNVALAASGNALYVRPFTYTSV